MESEVSSFVVARVDRRGQLPPTYLRKFALAGRNGLQQLAFGPRSTAHFFERHAEAEDIARRLRRRVSQADYEFIAEEAPTLANA
jgi:hypothetical protein